MRSKKILAITLVSTIAMTMGACGNSSADSTSSLSESSESETSSMTVNSSVSSINSKSEAKKYTIAWSDGNLANESNAVCTTVAKAYAESLGVNFELLDAKGEGADQVSQIETLVEKGVDCIIVQPYDAAACQAGVEMAIDAGVNVLVAKAPIEDNSICPLVAQDDTVAGEMELDWMADQLGEKGNIVVIEGPTGNSAAINRNDGINKALEKYPDMKVVYTQTGNWNREEGMSLMEDWLQTGTEIDGVVAHNDEMALGAYDALNDSGKAGTIPVIGLDGIDAALKSVKAGELNATVYQDVQSIAKKAIDVAVLMCKGEAVDDTYYIDPVLVTSDNVDDYLTGNSENVASSSTK